MAPQKPAAAQLLRPGSGSTTIEEIITKAYEKGLDILEAAASLFLQASNKSLFLAMNSSALSCISIPSLRSARLPAVGKKAD